MNPGLKEGMSSGSGCARPIMRLIGNWVSRSLTAQSGRRGGGLDGRMGDVVEGNSRKCVRLYHISFAWCGVWVDGG